MGYKSVCARLFGRHGRDYTGEKGPAGLGDANPPIFLARRLRSYGMQKSYAYDWDTGVSPKRGKLCLWRTLARESESARLTA